MRSDQLIKAKNTPTLMSPEPSPTGELQVNHPTWINGSGRDGDNFGTSDMVFFLLRKSRQPDGVRRYDYIGPTH